MDYKSNFITHLRQKRHMNVTAHGCEYKRLTICTAILGLYETQNGRLSVKLGR